MVFKAVAVDVDGTITYSDRRIDCRAVAALRSLHIPVIIATGNVLCVARTVAKLLGTGGNLIAENGGVVECGRVESDTSHMKECMDALEILKKHFSLERLEPESRITEIGLRRDFDVEKAREILYGNAPVDIVDTGFAIHIKSKKINKGMGLKRMAQMMNLEVQDFVAIGDSPNDIEMIEAAGLGVAVGNAHPELKKVAGMVTKGEYGEGVEEVLRELKRRGEIR